MPVKNKDVVLYTYRYMWMCQGSDSVNFRVVTDTLDNLKQFETSLKDLPALIRVGKEYLHEYVVSKIGHFDVIYDSNDLQENNSKGGEKK